MILIRNATLLDPASGDLTAGVSVVVEGERIREVSPRPIKVSATLTLDAGGRTLMPGLIDCHVHVFLSEVNIRALEAIPLTLMTARGAALMRAMLDRGFTTVRDTGGADWGIREGVAQGYLPGPRLFVAGRPIGQTGGHSDSRRRTDTAALVPLPERDGLHARHRRRRGRSAPRRARAASPGRGPHQDHGVGRSGLALRSAREPAVHDGRDPRGGRGGGGLQALRVRPRLRRRGGWPARSSAACA